MVAAIQAPPVNNAMNRQLVIGSDATQRELTGDEKAAVLLLSLGPDFGRPILEELDEMEIKILSRTMVRMGSITQEMLDSLFAEFVTGVSANGTVSGNSDTTQRLLMSFLPADRVDAIMEEIRGPAGRNMWEKLSNVQEDILATYLKNEYPQTIAVVLSKIDTEHASKVLAALPEELAMNVVKRMLSLDPVPKEILEKIEQTLRTEFMSTLSHSKRRDSHEQMAEIFNSFDRQTEARFITSLEEADREGAERIKSLMFTFEDLARLDGAAIQALLSKMDKKDLALALKGANDTIKEFFYSNMSARSGKLLKDDMETMGPVRLKDVDEAQGRMVSTAKDMAARGEIVINKGKGDEQMVGMMTSAAPTKFRFDLDLGHRQERNTVITESGLAALIADARAQGRAEGLAEGERTATVRAAQVIASAAQNLADHTAAMNAALDDNRHATLNDAVSLAAAIGRKLAHHLIAREPTAEIEALITECLASLDAVPHLVVRCHPELAEDIREIATARITNSGFSGRLVVLGDPDLQLSDARIEWADGGVVRDTATLDAEIDTRITDFLAAQRGQSDDTGGPAQ